MSHAEFNPPDFAVGQEWQLSGPDPHETTTLTICRIVQDAQLGRLVFVTITGTWTPILTEMQRGPSLFPCSEDCIRRSVTCLLSENAELPDLEKDFEYFLEEYNANRVGVFEYSLAQYLEFYKMMADRSAAAKSSDND